MAKGKGSEGWTFVETAEGVIGTKRDPADATVEWTAQGRTEEEAQAAADEQDRVRGLLAQDKADQASAQADELRAQADALEGKEPKTTKAEAAKTKKDDDEDGA